MERKIGNLLDEAQAALDLIRAGQCSDDSPSAEQMSEVVRYLGLALSAVEREAGRICSEVMELVEQQAAKRETYDLWNDDPAVPCVGRILGIGKNATYVAARRGEFPVIRIGGRVIVPIKRFHDWLEGNIEVI